MKPVKANKRRIQNGKKVHSYYCALVGYDPVDKREHYSITDVITDLLHFAKDRGDNPETILFSAKNHFDTETTK